MGIQSTWIEERTSMAQMDLNPESIERRLRFVGLSDDDMNRIASIRSIVTECIDELTQGFFDYLGQFEEARTLSARPELLERARQLKKEHLLDIVGGHYGVDYVEKRMTLALIYSKAGIEPRLFLGAFHHLLESIRDRILNARHHDLDAAMLCFVSIQKVAFFDLGLIIDTLAFARERVILQQQEAIRELSTPVLQVRDRLLVLPIIGVIDTHRARLLTENLLRAIRANRARVAILDITGVGAVDSKVANHLLQAVAASRLMGATVIVTGLSSDVAQTLVTLGVDLSKLNTIGDLQGGIEEAERLLGLTMGAAAPTNGHLPAEAVAELV
jgi:rsbT co-antagonist protein RsbR